MSTTTWIFAGLSVLGLLGESAERDWRRALGLTAYCLVVGILVAVLPSGSPGRVYVIVGAIIGAVLVRAWQYDRSRSTPG